MAGRARVFSLTLWLMARACAYLRAAFAVARATAAEHAISLWDLKNKKSILRYVYMQVCAHRVRRMQVSKRVPL